MDWQKNVFRKCVAFLKSRNALVFLFFYILSSAIWFGYSYYTEREMRATVTIKYVGLPFEKEPADALPSTLSFVIVDKGKNLLDIKHLFVDTITVDLSDNFDASGRLYINFEKECAKMLVEEYKTTSQLVDFNPATFETFVSTKVSKRVPVVLNGEVRIGSQFVLTQPVALSVDSVTVRGTADEVALIDSVVYDIPNEMIESSCVEVCRLSPINHSVDATRSTVELKVDVERIAEKHFSEYIRIDGANSQQRERLRTFPPNVDVYISMGVSKYHEVNDVRPYVDYSEINDSTKTLEVKLDLQGVADYAVKNIRIEPCVVEFVVDEISDVECVECIEEYTKEDQ